VAARSSHEAKLPMAHSVMLANARQFDAVMWTQNAGLAGTPGVRYVAKGSAG